MALINQKCITFLGLFPVPGNVFIHYEVFVNLPMEIVPWTVNGELLVISLKHPP